MDGAVRHLAADRCHFHRQPHRILLPALAHDLLRRVVALSLVWGKLQNGGMFAFNSHFNFGLLFVPFILLAIGIAALPDLDARFPAPLLYGFAAALLVLVTKDFDLRSDFPSLAEITRLVETAHRAAHEDKQASRTKFLMFEHHLWPQATGIGLALQRYGYQFRVEPGWHVMFGDRHVVLVSRFLDALSRLAAGVSDDPRVLSCGFTRITFGPGPASQ